MTTPDVLVILPTLGDRLDTLTETLQSVEVQRSDVNLTLVVIVPGTAAEAIAAARGHGAIIVDDPRQGISEAINRGIAVRTTERYYAWIGDDDLFRPGGLRVLQRMLDNDDGAVVSYGGCDYIDPGGRTVVTSSAGRLAMFLLPWGPDLIPHPGSMIRLDALRDIGNFDRTLKYAMDLDAFLKLRGFGRFLWTRRSVSAFRWHPDSLTVANRYGSSAEAERVKRRHLPAGLKPISPLWHVPVRWASAVAATRLNRRARSFANA